MNTLHLNSIVSYDLDCTIPINHDFTSIPCYVQTSKKQGDLIKNGDKVTVLEILISSFARGFDTQVHNELLNEKINPLTPLYEEMFHQRQKEYLEPFKLFYSQLAEHEQLSCMKAFIDRWTANISTSQIGIMDVIFKKHYTSMKNFFSSSVDLFSTFLNSFTDFKLDDLSNYSSSAQKSFSYIKHIIEADKNGLNIISPDIKELQSIYSESINSELYNGVHYATYKWNNINKNLREIETFLKCFNITKNDIQSDEVQISLSKKIFDTALLDIKNQKSSDVNPNLMVYPFINKKNSHYSHYLNTLNDDEIISIYGELKTSWENNSFSYWLQHFSFIFHEIKVQHLKRNIDWDEKFLTDSIFKTEGSSVIFNELVLLKYLTLLENINVFFTTKLSSDDKDFEPILLDYRLPPEYSFEHSFFYSYVQKFQNFIPDDDKLKQIFNAPIFDKLVWDFSFNNLASELNCKHSYITEINEETHFVSNLSNIFLFNSNFEADFFSNFLKDNLFKKEINHVDINFELISSKLNEFLMNQDIISDNLKSSKKFKGKKF